MEFDPFAQALALVLIGIGVSLYGRRLQRRYFRDFPDESQGFETPQEEFARIGTRRAVVILLTGGVMFVFFGVAIAGKELLRLLGWL